jgi:prepilin-type N-terminal cleavage/methylation domain-containing protein
MLYPFSRLCRPARSPASGSPALRKKRGFNLIESAVVLGVLGLVIGGIWYAAASVRQSQRINETATGILQIANGARRLFSYSDYPTTNNTSTYVTGVLVAAGLIPTATSPTGANFSLALSCYSVCPMIQVGINGPALSEAITSSDCIQLIRRFAGLAKDNTDFLYAQRNVTSGPTLFLYPPIDPTQVTCPEDTTYITFWFKP